ncbi:MAG: multidrug resistance protein [Armatimonadetes bacterium]|nr:multidrug resistance protein [Armatimonadota bacterium]
MQGNLTPGSFGLIWIAITLGSFGQILLKLGLGHKDLGGGSIVATLFKIVLAMTNPYLLGGLALYIISTFFWILVLSRVRLSVAYPLISMSYFMVVILSALVLHERVNWAYAVAGLAFISAGVSCIGLGLGRARERGGT